MAATPRVRLTLTPISSSKLNSVINLRSGKRPISDGSTTPFAFSSTRGNAENVQRHASRNKVYHSP